MEGSDPELFSSDSSFNELRSMRQNAMVALGATLAAHAAESEYVEPFRGGVSPRESTEQECRYGSWREPN